MDKHIHAYNTSLHDHQELDDLTVFAAVRELPTVSLTVAAHSLYARSHPRAVFLTRLKARDNTSTHGPNGRQEEQYC